MEKDDVELIQRVLSGDETAFSILVKRYQKGVHALAWRKVKDFHIAEEITQDTFLQAHKKLASLKNPSQFPGWLYVIADRLCRSWFRKQRLKNIQSLETTREETLEKIAHSSYICEQRESAAVERRREIVQKLMAKLPESERTVMVLYYLGEMNCKEISKFLGVSPHTVKSRLRRARERLKNEEHILHETFGSIPLHPNLTENIMRNIDPVKQTPSSGAKPLLPFPALGASVILVILLMGASHQYIARSQQPYSLNAQSEPTIEIIDAPIVLNSQSKRDLQNRVGNETTHGKNSNGGLSEVATPEQSDKNIEMCTQNLLAIGKAIEAYLEVNGDYPEWLSDLHHPRYLPEPDVLICPSDRLGGKAAVPRNIDPKMPVSYGYQFHSQYRERIQENRTMYGDGVPLVRCRHHSNQNFRCLNLSYSYKISQSWSIWEAVPEQLYDSSEEAIAAMEIGLQQQPGNERLCDYVYPALARLYIEIGREDRVDGVIDLFKASINTDYPRYYLTLAKLLEMTDRDEERLQVFKALAEQDPNDLTVHQKLAEIYQKLGDAELAKKHRLKAKPVTESIQSDIVPDITQWNLPEKAKARFGKGRVRELTYFPDGTRLAVWSTIGIWIYDVRTGAEIELFARDAAEAIGMALSPDGQTFAFTGGDENIYLWDLQMKRQKNVFTGHTSFVSSLAFSPTGEILASGGYDATVRLWDVRTGELLRTLVGHTDGVMSVVYSPDGKTLASVSNFVEVEDNMVCLWNVQTGQLLQTITELPSKVYPVAYSPDSLTLVSGSRSRDSKIRFWDVQTGELIKTIPTDMASVTSVVYSPDGRTLASGSRGNKNIYLWDVDTGKLLKTLIGHTDQVGSLVYAPDGKMLASKSEDGTVRFWDPHTGELLKTISGYTFFARSVAFSPDGGTLVSSEGADKTIVLRDVQTGKTLKTLVDRTDSAGSVKYSPDRWWLRSTGSHSVKYSPDGKIIASGSWDGPIRLWDVQTGRLLRTLIGHKEGAPSIAYSPDGTVLISGSWDNTIRFWDLHTGELMRTLTGNTTDVEPRQGVRSISLSRDGQTLAAATDENVIRLWDAHTGDIKATLTGHTDAGAAVAFSPNKSLLASGGHDHTIRMWNTTTGELLLTFPEQPNYVMSIAFSPDGQRIASGGWREIYISDLATGKYIATFTGHGEWVRSVAFSPDGKMLASGSDDGTVLLWDMTQIQPQND